MASRNETAGTLLMEKKILAGMGRGARMAALATIRAKEEEVRKPLGRAQRLLQASLSAAGSPEPKSDPSSKKCEGHDSENVSLGRGRGLLAAWRRQKLAAEVAPLPVSTLRDPSSSDNQGSKPAGAVIGVEDKKIVDRQVTIGTNMIHLVYDKDKVVHRYHVDFNPTIDSMAFRYTMLRQRFPRLQAGMRCYDGASTLYLPYQSADGVKRYSCEHPEDQSSVEMVVKYKGRVIMSENVQMLNILMNNVTKELRLARLGRHHFDYKLAQQIPQYKLEIWPGFITAVQEKEGGIFLTCDVIHRVLRTETVLEVLGSLRGERYKEEAYKQLVGATVLARYNNCTYRIDDIVFDMSPMSTFEVKNGPPITFVEYYKKMYGLGIRNSRQPLLISKAKKKRSGDPCGKEQQVFLVPEICHLTGISDSMQSDFRVMKGIANCAKVTPAQRDLGLRKFLKAIKENENARAMLNEWGLRLPDEATYTDGRVLPVPKILLGDRRHAIVDNGGWARDLRSNKALRAVDIEDWVLVHSSRDQRRAQSFANLMQRCGPGMGMLVSQPHYVPIANTGVEGYVNAIRSHTNDYTQVVVVIAHQKRDAIYSAIKKTCLRDRSVACQVVNSNALARENQMRPIVQNIALQINAKLGGALWAVDIPLRNSMVCGIDTYHDPAHRSNSVGAFVASMDSKFTSYYSQAILQKPGQELFHSLTVCFTTAFQRYHQLNDGLPDTIIVYRDGVSDYNLNTVKQFEVEQIRQACSVVEKYSPKIIYIVVQKRISTRIYLANARGLENCPPGTIVDKTITKRGWDNFLLVSQQLGPKQGTARPNHYIVVHNDAQMKIEFIQKLTYAMCHLCYNWPGTVHVPAPCLYAHKLAYLVGHHLKAEAHPSLADKLYYL